MTLDTLLQNWLDSVSSIVDLTLREKEEITRAGAKVFSDELIEVTRREHTSTRKYKLKKHLYQSVGIGKSKNRNGTHIVGFKEEDKNAYIARFVNDGTKRQRATHFITNLQNSKEVQAKVFEAEKRTYDKIIERKMNARNS